MVKRNTLQKVAAQEPLLSYLKPPPICHFGYTNLEISHYTFDKFSPLTEYFLKIYSVGLKKHIQSVLVILLFLVQNSKKKQRLH